MTSFGLNSAADFLQKLREERADFLASNCLSPRHALNTVMTGYHMHEWVWGELKKRPGFPHRNHVSFRDSLARIAGTLIKDAGLITDGTKHFQPKIKTGKHKGAFRRDVFQDDAFDVSYLWVERNGKQQRAEDFIDELIQFWERFFEKHELPRYGDGSGKASVL